MFNNLFLKIVPLWDNVEKYGTARESTEHSMMRRMRIECRLTKAANTHIIFK